MESGHDSSIARWDHEPCVLAPDRRSKMAADASPPLRGRDRFMGRVAWVHEPRTGTLNPRVGFQERSTLNIQRSKSNGRPGSTLAPRLDVGSSALNVERSIGSWRERR